MTLNAADFGVLEEEIAPFQIGSRTLSSAQIAWFLERVWRVEPEEVEDAICDGAGDKGIDAIVVDEDLREITIIQCKHRDSRTATQGDADLRSLVGASVYFESPEGIDALLASRPNPELIRLISRLKVRDKLADGAYAVKLIFITNAELDPAGTDYLRAIDTASASLSIWNGHELVEIARRTRRPELRPETVVLESSVDPLLANLGGNTPIVVAMVDARQLIALPGIDDMTLFSRNVRLSLKRTRINRELADTVGRAAEHPHFAAFHNGLTILTPHLEVDNRQLTLKGVGVVNGCQSLVVLHDQAHAITDELDVLIRVIQVDPAGDLADRITYRTNNQNPVDIRDQRSTDSIQRGLQAQMRELYGHELRYGIRAGEDPGGTEQLDNKLAAQLLMAVYLDEPWNAVRKVRLFDEDYHRIFNHEVTAHRLRLMHEVARAVDAVRDSLQSDLASSFASVRFTLAYLLKRVLEQSGQGKEIFQSPERWFPTQIGAVRASLADIAKEVVDSLNYFMQSREKEALDRGENFDPKVVFKSEGGVRGAEHEVMRDIVRHAGRDQSILFNVDPAT